MREILFRGFTPDEKGRETITVNGKQIKGLWVQGSYWELHKTTYCFKQDYDMHPDNTEHYIVFDAMTDWGLPNRHLWADVIPETVGQYTGLTDKNGKKIFEGDIIVLHGKDLPHWYEDGQRVVVEYDDSGFLPLCEYDSDCGDYVFAEECKVIGNIHDNPELLEGSAEDAN